MNYTLTSKEDLLEINSIIRNWKVNFGDIIRATRPTWELSISDKRMQTCADIIVEELKELNSSVLSPKEFGEAADIEFLDAVGDVVWTCYYLLIEIGQEQKSIDFLESVILEDWASPYELFSQIVNEKDSIKMVGNDPFYLNSVIFVLFRTIQMHDLIMEKSILGLIKEIGKSNNSKMCKNAEGDRLRNSAIYYDKGVEVAFFEAKNSPEHLVMRNKVTGKILKSDYFVEPNIKAHLGDSEINLFKTKDEWKK